MSGFNPCPFCGDPAPDSFEDESEAWYVRCQKCGAAGPLRNRPSEAAQAWNGRVAHDAAERRNP